MKYLFGRKEAQSKVVLQNSMLLEHSVWPNWEIYCTFGNFLKHLTTIILPDSPTFLGNFGKAVKIYNFPSEIIFGQLL